MTGTATPDLQNEPIFEPLPYGQATSYNPESPATLVHPIVDREWV